MVIKNMRRKKNIFTLIALFFVAFYYDALAKFEFYAEHPFALQLSSLSVHLNDLTLYNGTIFIGYGDFGNHDFDTQICGVTPPETTLVCEETIQSEAAAHFRTLDGNLYVAGIDPREPNSDFYARRSPDNWLVRPAFTDNVAHIYDIESSGGNLWVTLTKFDDDARVMRGNDTGEWVESLFVTPPSGHTPTNYSVLYFIAEFGGALYTQAFDTEEGIRPYSFMSTDNGESWQQGPNILLHVPPGPNSSGGVLNFRHEIFADVLIMKQSRFLTSFDGTSAATLRTNVQNIALSGDYFYVLEEGGDIFRTKDLVDWSFVVSAPENSTSIEIFENDIFVGTEDAKILRNEGVLEEPGSSDAPHFFPVLYYLILDPLVDQNQAEIDLLLEREGLGAIE